MLSFYHTSSLSNSHQFIKLNTDSLSHFVRYYNTKLLRPGASVAAHTERSTSAVILSASNHPRLLTTAAIAIPRSSLIFHHRTCSSATSRLSVFAREFQRLPSLIRLFTTSLHVMDASFDTRTKRKHPSSSSSERPKKLLRSDKDISPPATDTNGHDTNMTPSQPDGDVNGDAHETEDMKLSSRVQTAAETAEWQETIEKVVRKVVAIHFCMTCSFDTESALSSEATGFVVDAERGYILTNRVCCLIRCICSLAN